MIQDSPGWTEQLAAGDRIRAVGVAGSVLALFLVPTVGPRLLDTREEVARFDTAVTPPDYAFAIWAPIFAGCAANAVRQCAAPASPMSRTTGWYTAGAYAANAAWSIASQAGKVGITPVLLPVATASAALAHRATQDLDQLSTMEDVAASSTGLLLGWTALASTINASIGTQLAGLPPSSRTAIFASSAGLLGTSAAVAWTVGHSRHGAAALAAAALWGLLTTVAERSKPPAARTAAALGALTVAGMLTRGSPSRSAHGAT